ncbi:MAG: 3-deoxy-manno-octulosonate cytidylyltransferase [Verrucomicrobia bacterium]|nr:MAG: 3-deoxy-manno-octulosonate cytidylyltransferase [Verrucomicrobiota bacterium]
MSDIIGVIPARWGSTRFPGKSLFPILGKPLLQWVVERARQAESLNRLLVATDDERIRAAAQKFGAEVVMTSPEHPSGTDRIAEAVRGLNADVVINIQGDEPLIDPALINALGQTLASDNSWDMATAATPIREERDRVASSVVKVVRARDGRALYFSRATIPFIREKDSGGDAAANLYWRHIGIYAYRRTFLERLVQEAPCALEQAEKLEQLRALWLGCRMKVLETNDVGLGVDTPDDVPRAEQALRKAGLA